MKSGIAGFADPLDVRIHREAFEQRLYKRQLHVWILRAICGIGGLLFWEVRGSGAEPEYGLIQ